MSVLQEVVIDVDARSPGSRHEGNWGWSGAMGCVVHRVLVFIDEPKHIASVRAKLLKFTRWEDAVVLRDRPV